jgi:flagellar L-ring protein precursor FlgH
MLSAQLKLLIVGLAIGLSGCAMMQPSIVRAPVTARAEPPPAPIARNGAIFQANASHLALFEDRRARFIGDTLTISIIEKTSASKKSSSTANREAGDTFAVPTLANLPGKGILGASLSASANNKFTGKGESASNNDFTGTLAVTVVEILPNGNLVVAGEKQFAINQGTEFLRFSGVVNPNNITSGNVVNSTQVADARIEYRGNGYIDEAQTMGWLARFFMNVLPF